MSNWTEADLQRQFNNALNAGWLPHFEIAALVHGFDPELLLAIASRETDMRNIKGDFRDGIYHGYGLMQVDIGTYPDFCHAWTPDNVQGSIETGAEILSGKRQALAAQGVTDLRAVVAAYNTGHPNVLRSIQAGADPDRTTTGHDYGRDVLARMDVFVKLRSA
jgi:hypothetical protein